MRMDGPDAPWRTVLTAEERREIEQLETGLSEVKRKLNAMSCRRQFLRNRAVMRLDSRRKNGRVMEVGVEQEYRRGVDKIMGS